MEDGRFFQKIFESALEGILVATADGKIVRANRSCEKMFGYKKGELDGVKVESLVPAAHRKHHVAHREEYQKKPKARPMGKGSDLEGLKIDGTVFPVEISLNHITLEGESYVMAYVMDVTARKAAEFEINKLNQDLEHRVEERTQDLANAIGELQEANLSLEEEVNLRNIAEKKANEALLKERELGELKSRFVSMASHEFRTPLSTVLSSNALIAKYKDSENLEKREKHINRINSAVNNLTEILNDFLSLDKLEAGKVSLNLREFDLAELGRDIVDELESNLKSDQVIAYTTAPKEIAVTLDRQMIRNILINLVSNAIKYSESGQQIELSIREKGQKVLIEVIDNGIGIPEIDQKHMFERFFRAKNATNLQGTGLGLNIVKKFLDLMNGTITFASKEGEGTKFTVTLPKTIKS
jgi:PAS domain S-box-containing protein